MNHRRLRSLLFFTAACSPIALLAQDPLAPQSTQIPNPASQDSNTGGSSVQGMRDATFLRKASEGGFAEVQLGKLAAEKGASDDVKSFGHRMVDDHTKLNEKLGAIADSMGVMAPKHLTKEDQAEYDKLNTLSGDAFDKEYITAMVKDHHADLREFRIEVNSTTDPTLKQAVTEGAQVIRQHMIMIDKIARGRGIETPAGHGHPAAPPSPPA